MEPIMPLHKYFREKSLSACSPEELLKSRPIFTPTKVKKQTIAVAQFLLKSLERKQETVIRYFFFEGLSFSEIAERCHRKESSVKEYYLRGLARLRALGRMAENSKKTKSERLE